MTLTFSEAEHKYTSDDNIPWRSVTGVIHSVCQPFDWTPEQSSKSKKAGNKWAGMDPVEIQAAWDAENQRSKELGHWYHNIREQALIGEPGVVYTPMTEGVKIAPEQKLKDGIYPEHFCYLQSARVCGQSDLVTVEGSYLDIDDYKTCKEIKKNSHVSWEGISKKMKAPVEHVEDCDLMHYTLQLSLYAFMIQRHNPHLTVRNMTIHHVLFEEEGRDKYLYPIYKKNESGEPIVKDIIRISVPYMKTEAMNIINAVKDKRI